MQTFFDVIFGFGSLYLPNLIAMLAAGMVVSSIVLFSMVALAVAVWIVFKRVHRAVTGRNFVFTSRASYVLSSGIGVFLSGAYAIKIYAVLESGVIIVNRRGINHYYFWREDRFGYIWAIVWFGLSLAAFWAVVAYLLSKVAASTKKAT